MKAVRRHFSYLSRKGDLTIETDDGQELRGKEAEADLLKDWDLDIQEQRPTSSLGPGLTRKAPKLVHKVLFSMPPGTPPKKVLEAVRAFAREEFGLRHRYAMVLHVDEPHPHVHMVVKAVSERGIRLNIRKETLRRWRREFARYLRESGVSANATERAVRGEVRTPKLVGVYRADRRGDSRHVQERLDAVLSVQRGDVKGHELGTLKIYQTRKAVDQGWRAIGDMLAEEGRLELAIQVRRFAGRLPTPATDREVIAARLKSPSHNDRNPLVR